MAWAMEDGEPVVWTPGQTIDEFRAGSASAAIHVQAGKPVYAHNAPFELAIWNDILVPRYGWPVLKPEQTFCTMACAYAMGLPGALEDAALSLGLAVLKDTEGRSLMLRMSRPRSVNPTVWWDEPEKLARLYAYCQQDVRVERELRKRLMPLSNKEREVWLMDYAINQRGVAVDLPTAKAAVKLVEVVKQRCDNDLKEITKGAVQTATALGALKEWLNAQGVNVEGLAKQDVSDLLAGALPPLARRGLTLRQESGLASTAKLQRLTNLAAPDGRLRNLVQYHGAATGRWAARGVQVHNLPRDIPPQATVEKILALVRAGDLDAIDLVYGPPMSVVSKCLRGCFVAAPGNVLIAGDFANVEGRGVAWLSGEAWKLKAFREADAGTGPGLYELAYAKAFSMPVDSIKNPSFERQVGKVMELAFGFGGGVGAFVTMGSTLGVKVGPEKADQFKSAWRAAHPRTVATWKELQRAAISAVRSPGAAYTAGYPGRQVKFKTAGSFLWCLLPSGRALCYPYSKVIESNFGPQLTYMTVPSALDKQKGKTTDDPKNASNWARCSTYGGSLMENVVQALCRDLLVDSMLTLQRAGARIVLHVHDEIVIEVSAGKAASARAEMERIMRSPPAWAADFPLWASCSVMGRYGK